MALADKGVPAFLSKTYHLVDHASTDALLSWSEDGQSFVIHKPKELAQHVFPKFFKHNKMASFVRQLNMYGFSKTSTGPEELTFKNEFFVRGRPDLLARIVRKKSSSALAAAAAAAAAAGSTNDSALRADVASLKRSRSELEAEVANLRVTSDTMASMLSGVAAANDALRVELQATVAAQAALSQSMTTMVNFLTSAFPAHADALAAAAAATESAPPSTKRRKLNDTSTLSVSSTTDVDGGLFGTAPATPTANQLTGGDDTFWASVLSSSASASASKAVDTSVLKTVTITDLGVDDLEDLVAHFDDSAVPSM